MYVVNVLVCVGVAVVQLLQIPPAQCFLLRNSNETLITSDPLYHNDSINSSLQDNTTLNEATPNNLADSDPLSNNGTSNFSIQEVNNAPEIALHNFAGQMSDNTLDTLYNNSTTNSSIHDFNKTLEHAIHHFVHSIEYTFNYFAEKRKNNTSNTLHNDTASNISELEFKIALEVAISRFFSELDNYTLDTLNKNMANSSIQEIDNWDETGSNGITAQMDSNPVPKTDFSQCPSCTCGKNSQIRRKRIVGGVVAEQNEFPWMVALVKRSLLSQRNSIKCGAIIITKQHLLTAAHCVKSDSWSSPAGIEALFGRHKLNLNERNETDGPVRRIKEIILHPEFNLSTMTNDIAIIKLDSPISFNTSDIQPACLPQLENQNYTGLTAIACGWGTITDSLFNAPFSEVLRKVELSVEDCAKTARKNEYLDDVICAYKAEGGKDSCHGDSGGPLHISGAQPGTMEVIGVISAGPSNVSCGRPNTPGYYTRISLVMEWVKKTILAHGECLCFG